MNLLTPRALLRDAPDEVCDLDREAYVANRLTDAERFRAAAIAFLETTDDLEFPIDYVEGLDWEDTHATLKACVGFSRGDLESRASDEATDRFNDGRGF